MIISFDYGKMFKEYLFINNQLRNLKNDNSDAYKKLENRKNFLRYHLKNFKVSFGDILQAVYPNYTISDYIITTTPIYGLRGLKPLDTKTLYCYFSKQQNFDKGIFIEIALKIKKTNEEIVFYKTFDLNHLLEDNTTIKDNLTCVSTKEKNSELYLNSLYLDNKKTKGLMFGFLDFKYNLICKTNIEVIFKKANKKQLILNNEK